MQKTLSLGVQCSEFDDCTTRRLLADIYQVPASLVSVSSPCGPPKPCGQRRQLTTHVSPAGRMLQSSAETTPIILTIIVGDSAGAEQLRARLSAVDDAALGAALGALGGPMTATTDTPWVAKISTVETEGDCPA